VPLIELRDITKSFGDNRVLQGISLQVEAGETLVVLGRSGIGKSVTLLIITGLLAPDSGQIILQGQDITHLRERDLISVRRRFSYVFQSGALFDSLTVFENVAFPMSESRGREDPETVAHVQRILEHLDLAKVADLYPQELSTGMKKRVAIARAIAVQPLAILYDEPTTGVDPLTAKLISRTIKGLQQQLGVTSIVVTHDLKCARMIADRVAFLHDGRIYFHDTFDRFLASDLDELVRFKHSLPSLLRYIGA